MEINLKRQLTPFEWLQLPQEARTLFKETFKIPRTGGSIVVDNRVISDGHTIEDLGAVSLKSLQEYLGTTEDHWDRLLQLTINKMENGNSDFTGTTSGQVAAVDQGTTGKRRGRPKVKETV